jgi:hypothetical protein
VSVSGCFLEGGVELSEVIKRKTVLKTKPQSDILDQGDTHSERLGNVKGVLFIFSEVGI